VEATSFGHRGMFQTLKITVFLLLGLGFC
jgi:hypothetical protein